MCTGALSDPAFLKALALVARHEGPLGPGAREFTEILQILSDRRQGVMWANRLSRLRVGVGELAALAPSELTQTDALRRAATDPSHLPREPTPNDTCLVLWYEAGEAALLLGADLETGTERVGWTAVLATFSPGIRAALYKVAHHGSDDANHAGIWAELLTEAPHSVTTPYSPSRRPRSDDASRLRALSTAHFTGPVGTGRVGRSAHVQRMVRAATATGVRRREGSVGHVRLRRALASADEWAVEYSPEAGPL